jgi:hypothetical protein
MEDTHGDGRGGGTRMSWYRRTHEQLWTDKWVRTLKPERKLLWLYLLTGTQTNGIGLHTFKVAEAAEDLGFSKKKVLEALEDFAKIQRICWDRDSNLVWIPKWIRYNAPDGPNQVKFYEKAISAFLPHPFARALRILLVAACQDKQWAKRILTPHLALFIRDDLRCRYCQKVPERIDDLVVDTPNPDAGTSEKFDWERNVTACQSCVLRKTDGNSAGIGSGFVAGFHFSIAKATAKLIANAELRERVRKLCDGLPSEFADIEDIAGVAALGTGATNSGNGFGTLLEPFRIQETVNRKQEAGSSKQEAGKRGWENPRLASGDSAAPAPGDGDEERGKVTEIGPLRSTAGPSPAGRPVLPGRTSRAEGTSGSRLLGGGPRQHGARRRVREREPEDEVEGRGLRVPTALSRALLGGGTCAIGVTQRIRSPARAASPAPAGRTSSAAPAARTCPHTAGARACCRRSTAKGPTPTRPHARWTRLTTA